MAKRPVLTRVTWLALAGCFVLLMLIGLAPYIGLGKNESFVLYQWLGLARREAFFLAAYLTGGVVAFIVFDKQLRRLACGVRWALGQAWQKVRALGTIIERIFSIGNLANAGLVCVSLFAGYLLVEAGYRVYVYGDLMSQRDHVFDEAGLSIHDEKTGYRWAPNRSFERDTPFPRKFRINRHGHIARGDYTLAKPDGQFRIGVIGDSYTAAVKSDVRWTDELMDVLNASPSWRGLVGGKETLVINFGLTGIGTLQFDEVFEELALPFDLDFLIVNFLSEDLIRKHYERGIVLEKLEGADTPAQAAEMLKSMFPEFLRRDLVRCCHPEVLAVTLGDGLSLKPLYDARQVFERFEAQFSPRKKYTDPYERNFDNPADAIEGNLHTFGLIREHFPEALFLLHPSYSEYDAVTDDYRFGIFFKAHKETYRRLRSLMAEVQIVEMRDYLPNPETKEELDRYFNIPYDQHHNGRGNRLYGQAVAKLMIGTCNNKAGRLRCRLP